MESASHRPTLESLVFLWPVASTLSNHLPVGDLITLSRLSVSLRVLLHGFAQLDETALPEDPLTVRKELHIGRHGTPYWQRLKDRAPFECSSSTHTKGPAPKPCRYCSKPICDACIVRSSFARGHENTFQNRTRYLCKNCWETGNVSRSQRFPLDHSSKDSKQRRRWYDPEGSTRDYCTCTLKDDGRLCLDCKDLQNWEAISSADTYCHGQDCNELLDADKDRRRICLWCDKALPRHLGGTTRHHWNQKMVEARARNMASRQADLEEYNRKRLKLMRMSRREMRGDEAVKDDPDADLPQFVRHLDTINYRSHMPESAAPGGDSVYDSKRGYWRYSPAFLLKMRARCAHVPVPPQVKTFTQKDLGALCFARTNAEKLDDLFTLSTRMPSLSEERLAEWCTLKAVILEYLLVQKLSYEITRQAMLNEYDFNAGGDEYHAILHAWCTHEQIREYRGSLDTGREGEDVEHSRVEVAASATGDRDVQRCEDGDYSHEPSHDPTLLDTLDAGEHGNDDDKRSAKSDDESESEARLMRKIQQDREESLALAQSQSTALARVQSEMQTQVLSPPTPTPPAFPSIPSSSTGQDPPLELEPELDLDIDVDIDIDDELAAAALLFANDDEEEPPPYTADGWEWPPEAHEGEDQGQG